MMDYYVDFWLHPMTMRKPDQTYWLDGVPQVEVNFEIEVPLADNPVLADLARRQGADCILYRGTIDRMVQDPETGFLWVDEYKTAKVAEHFHYQTDPQCTTYVWAASHIYDQPVAGVIYHQFIKKMPEAPRILSSGKISTASNLTTSYPLYKNALVQMYGSVESAPKSNVEFLTNLAMSESVDRDKYIVREKVYRNNHTLEAEAQKILLEMEDMLNPDLPLYPNPTRDCSRMCSFLAACVSMDDGGDWEEELAQEYADRDQAADRMWRKRLPPPEALLAMRDAGEKLPRLEDIQIQIKSMSDNRRAEMDAGIFTFD
jgi:dGTP triphosphohydrolase